jgi:hypothetical protein
MKKKYYVIVAICLTSLGLMAQPTITYSGNAPQIGDTYNFSGDNGSYDPGPSGANQNWDFSDITPTFSRLETAVTPESTPFADDFPEATIAFHFIGDNESYSYAQISTTEMLNDGVGFDPGGENEFFIHYTDAVKLMQYPFSFSDTYTDTYFSAYNLAELLTHERGNITVTADAWGSVTTPEDTYSNTLRVKSERVYTDSVWMSGIFLYVNTYTQTDYEWYTATSHTPVISISNTGDGSSVTYRTDGVGIGEDQAHQSQINIYPNPATNKINVKLPKGTNTDMYIYIFDLQGKQVAQLKKTGNDQFSADISALASGEYVIPIKINSEKYTTTKFIKTARY